VGLKKIDPDLKGTLGQKIVALEKAGKLTPEIIEWSKEVRDLGNDAAHEEAPPTRSELTDLQGFTEMVLRYLFTLPNTVKKRRGEKLPWEEERGSATAVAPPGRYAILPSVIRGFGSRAPSRRRS